MADALTASYDFIQPEVGASADTWGSKLNTNLASLDKLLGAITTGGSSNAYTLTSGQSLTALTAGMVFQVRWNHANTDAATINVDGIGAVAITKNGTVAVASGDLPINGYDRIVYDGTQFRAFGVSQPLDALLTAIAALTTADDRMLDFTGSDTVAVVTYATVLSNIAAAGLASANVFTADQRISKATPALNFYETAQASDEKLWKVFVFGTQFVVATRTDADGTGVNVLRFSRGTGTALSYAEFGTDVRIPVAPSGTATNSVGFLGIPMSRAVTASITLALSDSGGHISIAMSSGSQTVTIPPNSSVAFPDGTVVQLRVNASGNAFTVVEGSGVTLTRGDGTAGTGTRTVAVGYEHFIHLEKVDTNAWTITGIFT